jgi:sulfhydrogenase subunit alpha
MSTKTIKVDYLARVEGEGSLFVKIRGDEVKDVKLKVFEPPRFFEAFLRGRRFTEAPDITARICGICPVAYQMSAVNAMENICGVKVDGMLRELRRLLYCGEWIESHVLHMYMLHAPDFLGYPDALALAKDHPEVVKRGLRMKKCGNSLMTLLGGREIHPINVRVGGFYRVPHPRELAPIREELKWTLEAAVETARWVATLKFPEFEPGYEYVAMKHPGEYPLQAGRLVSNRGLDCSVDEWDSHFEEQHVEHSTALHCVRKGGGAYMVGPLARYNLNFDLLTPLAAQTAQEIGLGRECHNPFKTIVVRAIEVIFACEEALRIIDGYQKPDRAFVDVEPREGRKSGCSEAPRGICHHTYRIDGQGIIQDARIVPPTSQNQKRIETDLRLLVEPNVRMAADKLQWLCEQAIRNYDPCISCSVHFLKLELDRT